MIQRKTINSLKFILLITLSAIFVNCKENNPIETNTDEKLPVISTDLTMNNVTATTAEYGATITSDNGQTVSLRGVCWSTNIDPTLKDSVKTSGQGIGSFTTRITNLKPETTYYIRAFATNAAGTKYGGTLSFTTQKLPNVTTMKINNITTVSAYSGGTIIDNNIAIIAKGVCWNTSQEPTIELETKTNDGIGNSSFSSTILNLSQSTTYYVRAYIVTLDGVTYGQQETFTTLTETPETGTVSDVDGNIYHYITIGTQRWMVENLRTTKYRNGELIGTTTTPNADISSEQTPKYQWPCNGDESIVGTYGRLYTWHVVNDSRGLAPNGWHIASIDEWTTLQNYLIANGYNFDKTTTDNRTAKSLASNSGWLSGSQNTPVGTPANDLTSNNSTGLSIYPSAGRFSNGFYSIGFQSTIWTKTESGTYAITVRINNNEAKLLLNNNSSKSLGWAVRCVMD
jgi:uncharacterized protein (TIGR02145 family)